MKIKFYFIALFFLFLNCIATIKQFYPGFYFSEDRIYQNKALGFSLKFIGNWEIVTDPNKMKQHKSYAKLLHDSGAELLFVGFTVEKTHGTRAIAANLNETNMEYAKLIQRINKSSEIKDNGIYEDTINNIPFVVWEYEKDEFKFIELFFNVATYNIRMAFWSKPSFFEKFLPVYKEIMGSLSYYEKE